MTKKKPTTAVDMNLARGLERRTVVKSAAWAVPVIAAATVVPHASASVPVEQQNVIVTASCYGINILGIGQSFPQFTITAVGAPILAGSVFTFTGSGLANLTFGDTNGLGFFNFINSNTATFTLTSDISADTSRTIQVTGLLSAQALRSYTLTATTILGNANSISGDDSASQTLVGVSMLGIFVGYCGR